MSSEQNVGAPVLPGGSGTAAIEVEPIPPYNSALELLMAVIEQDQQSRQGNEPASATTRKKKEKKTVTVKKAKERKSVAQSSSNQAEAEKLQREIAELNDELRYTDMDLMSEKETPGINYKIKTQDRLKREIADIEDQIAELTQLKKAPKRGKKGAEQETLKRLEERKLKAEKTLKVKKRHALAAKKYREKLEKARGTGKRKAGRPRLEDKFPDLHSTILSCVPELPTDRKKRSDILTTGTTLDDLVAALAEKESR